MPDKQDYGKSCFWQPFTNMKAGGHPLRVRSGRGVMLELEDGRRLMDCISSWWVTIHGHGRPEIAEAISAQAKRLEQVICAGLTHEPAEMLASRLIGLLPGHLSRVFYSDDGSTAVEVGLKMAFQYWKNMGAKGRKRFLSFEGAYHGDTLGAMSVGHRSVFTRAFSELLFDVDFIPYPATHISDADVVTREEESLSYLDCLLSTHGRSYAALIIEPLVQGAGGMRMCRPEFLRQVEKRIRAHGILEIYDEVMTGFGRTGEYFACIRAKTAPDIICLSKGITGGFLPLAATVCTDEVFSAFYDDDPMKTFYHGHSYTANPLGCAAALASLDLLADGEHFRDIETWHHEFIEGLETNPRLSRLRVCGTIAAMDIDVDDAGYCSRIGPELKAAFIERGFLLRPLGNVLYVLPPYCITKDQLKAVYACIDDVVCRI